MYYEEAVINGVLHWRGSRDSEWKQYTAEALTIALTAERSRAKDLEALALKASVRIENVRAAIAG